MLAPGEEDAGPFRPQHPLVAVGGQEIDGRAAHVQGENAQPLDGVEKQQRPAAMDQFRQPIQVVPPAAGVGHPTDADNPRPAVAGGGEPVEIEPPLVGGDAPRFDATVGQMEPGILVRRELVGPDDHVVARPPGKPLGHQVDAGGGVADQGDFLGHGADHSGGQGPQLLDPAAPGGVVGGPVGRGVLGPFGQRASGPARSRGPRRHGRNMPTAGRPASGGGKSPNRRPRWLLVVANHLPRNAGG